jgi:hypothetical protein
MESKLTRRELMAQSTVLLLLVPVARGATGCSSSSPSSSPSSSVPPGAEAQADCTGVFTTSSVANNHTHTLCVATTDLTNPPAAGMVYTTSTTLNHDHTVTLTQAQLQSINAGMAVTVTSTGVTPNHDFAITKA